MKNSATPRHVADHLAAVTGQDHQTRGRSNAAQWTRCTRCGAQILTGLDDLVAAITVRCDPTSLDRAGEVTALLSGRATYTLTRQPDGRLLIRHRSHWVIQGHPADTATVLPAHACGQPLAPQTVHPTRRRQEAAHGTAPF